MKNNGWKSYLCLEIVEKMNRFCTAKFQNFLGAMPPDPHTAEGLGQPLPRPDLTPSALRRFAPPYLARGLRPLHRLSLYVVDILRYFKPCDVTNDHTYTSSQWQRANIPLRGRRLQYGRPAYHFFRQNKVLLVFPIASVSETIGKPTLAETQSELGKKNYVL